jgi:hypothetical protein
MSFSRGANRPVGSLYLAIISYVLLGDNRLDLGRAIIMGCELLGFGRKIRSRY